MCCNHIDMTCLLSVRLQMGFSDIAKLDNIKCSSGFLYIYVIYCGAVVSWCSTEYEVDLYVMNRC